jgi:hypothetical protein
MYNQRLNKIDTNLAILLFICYSDETVDRAVLKELQEIRDRLQHLKDQIPVEEDKTEEEEHLNQKSLLEVNPDTQVQTLLRKLDNQNFESEGRKLTDYKPYLIFKDALKRGSEYPIGEIERAISYWDFRSEQLKKYFDDDANYEEPTTGDILKVFKWLKFEEVQQVIARMLNTHPNVDLYYSSAINSWGTDNCGLDTLEIVKDWSPEPKDYIFLVKSDEVDDKGRLKEKNDRLNKMDNDLNKDEDK